MSQHEKKLLNPDLVGSIQNITGMSYNNANYELLRSPDLNAAYNHGNLNIKAFYDLGHSHRASNSEIATEVSNLTGLSYKDAFYMVNSIDLLS